MSRIQDISFFPLGKSKKRLSIKYVDNFANFASLYPCQHFTIREIIDPRFRYTRCIFFRVTSLEHLSLAEVSGELVRQKVYENGHKNVLGIWIDLEWKVKYSTILVFKVIFLCQKSAKSFWLGRGSGLQNTENTGKYRIWGSSNTENLDPKIFKNIEY